MPNSLSNHNFIITGGASGIGLATARILKQHGASLAVWDVNAGALHKVAGELAACVANVDITQPERVSAAMQETAAQMGTIHGVVHSAGIMHTGVLDQIPIEAHRRLVEVNLFGSIAIAHAAIPHLRVARGSLVFMASTAGYFGTPEFNTYGATKAGVVNLGQALRIELAGTGVHIGVVCPFFASTPMLDTDNQNARLFRRFGMKHRPEDVARAIVRGIERRSFMIWPTFETRFLFWLSRYTSFVGYPVMRMLWR
jgi:short-subunit dehydrogenase